MRELVVLIALMVLPVEAAKEPTRAQRIVDVINGPDARGVLIAAHRGGYANDRDEAAPENSVANVAVAVRKGFDLYETDIQRTKDGVFVVVHDATLERETNGTGAVSSLTLAELKDLQKRYRDGSLAEEKVATLEELLLAGKDTILFKADLKPGIIDHFDSLARLIDRLGMSDRVLLRTSMKDADAIARAFASGTPQVEVMFKVDGLAGVKAVAKRFSPRTIQINFAKGETLSDEKRVAMRAAIELGMLVETHSYGDAAQWAELIDAGVRMFHTANPDATLSYLKQHGWRPRELPTRH